MRKITRHPLSARADAMKRALLANGFALHDDGIAPQVESVDWRLRTFERPRAASAAPILLEKDGRYVLRSDLLAAQLPGLAGRLPLHAFSIGRVFDARDDAYPSRLKIEGVIAQADFSQARCEQLWSRVAQSAWGIDARAGLVPLDESTYEVKAVRDGDSFAMACLGKASAVARALLRVDDPAADVWLFSIDVDELAVKDFGLESREQLYSPRASFLGRFEDASPDLGGGFAAKASNVLRVHGYSEFFGRGLYEEDAYRKMNMIMESWDLNNRGVLLKEPLGKLTRVPTVLTPSLEDALEENFKAGEESAKLFEIGHHCVLEKIGAAPIEKTSISFGAFGPGIDRAGFRAEVDDVLTAFGIKNHFFIPTDMAIPYDAKDCWIVMDERMQYLGGNFGSICQKALDAHGIGVPAYMAQFEIPALEKKADEELAFTPPERS